MQNIKLRLHRLSIRQLRTILQTVDQFAKVPSEKTYHNNQVNATKISQKGGFFMTREENREKQIEFISERLPEADDFVLEQICEFLEEVED